MNKEERMHELLKHRNDKKIKTFNLFEDIEALLQENEQLKEKVKYQKIKIDNKDNWCQLIADIGFDYDGCNTIESLKGLIDELVRYALNSRDNYDYKEILKGDSLEEENKKYKEVIDKAIEYLEKSKLNQLDTYCKYLYIDFDTGKIENIDELLQILKGEDNNE